MRKHLKYSVAITLSLVLLSNPLLALALGEQKALSRPIATASSDYSSGSRKASKILKLPVSSSARTGKQVTSPEGQTITLLHDGRQLLTGGQGADGPESTAAIKDPHTNEVTLLPYGLQHSRAWHTATTLPDGTVLILGGIGADGQVVESAELFNPETQAFERLDASKPQSAIRNPKSAIALTPRAYHTATLVTEGVVLIVGGMSKDGKFQKKAQLFDPQSRTARTLKAAPRTPRYGHMATLLADGNVLIQGGADTNGKAIDSGEIYDPTNQRFTRSDTDIDQQSKIRSPELEASLPKDRETSVPVDSRIALRFSKPLRVETLNAETVTLTNAFGNVEEKIVPAEGGMLAFITPKSHLLPGTSYVLSLSRLSVSENLVLADTTISFTTAVHFPTNFRPIDNEEWIPNENSLRGDWRSGRADSPWRSLPPLEAAQGVTALAGQALTLNGQPLDNVTLKIEDKTAQTDSTGRFLLAEVPAGRHELLIDGRSASRAGKTYGMFEAAVNVEGGKTNVLSYTIWMPKIDIAHAVTIPSPTTREAVITTPRIPGLEVHIPPQTVIRDHDGNAVTEVSITPIPLDRTPFPLPQGVDVPIYFTVQPGGAYVHTYNSEGPKGARLIYPNYKHRPAGTRFDFWHYDPEQRGWYIYGQGTVADDARQVVPDPNVSIYEFTGAMVAPPALAPQDGPVDCSNDGDPVNLGTGLFVLSNTDLILPDVLPIALTRTYRQRDNFSRAFGIGASHSFDLFLVGSTFPYTYVDVILPDGGRIHYDRISPGTSFADAVYENTSSPTSFYKTRIAWNGNGYNLTLKDGTVFTFDEGFEATRPGQAGLLKIKDRYGIATSISRDSSGNVTQIASPNGRWIQFTNDASNRITQAKDNIGRTVNYTYDGSGRLWKVTDPGSGVTEYTYDSSNRMTSIKNPRGIIYVTNEYDTNGRVSRQTHIDGGVYQFDYTLDGNAKITQTDVTNPRGDIRRVTFSSSGHALTDIHALGKPEQQLITYARIAGTNQISNKIDPLGRTTTYTYDAMGNVTSITYPAGTPDAVTTSYTYEPIFNQVATVTDPLNHTTSYQYDNKGNLIGKTDPLNNQTAYAYNFAGQVVSVTDPLQDTTLFTYDAGDLVTLTDPMGHITALFKDAAGRMISLTNPLGHTVRYQYDALNRLTGITDPQGGVTSFTYDSDNNLLTMTDARNKGTTYTYDNMDRLATHTDPLLHTESYEYDLMGNLTKAIDRRGKVTAFTYDALNRRIFTGFGAIGQGGTAPYESTITYTYDGTMPCGCGGTGGRLEQLVDSLSGTITYGYDSFDRVTSEATAQGTVGYTYDAAGRRVTMTVPSQVVINYTYDHADRLTQIAQGTSTVTVGYDAASRRISLTLPDGVVTEYGYDTASRLTSIAYKKAAATLGNLTYDYDAAGQRKGMAGTFARTGLPQPVGLTSYNAANHQGSFGAQTLTYDNNGNLIGDGINTYGWNARNQLVSISGASMAATFRYDALGRRVSKTVNSAMTNFLYDGENVVQEQVEGASTANMLTGLRFDEVFTRSDSSGLSNSLTDGLGSAIALADSAGAILTQYTYEPFGKTAASGAASGNPSQFTLRENDSTGLYYYRARYYSPSLQRFISEDPISFAGGINLYAYVSNDPTNSIDPFGLKAYRCKRGLNDIEGKEGTISWVNPGFYHSYLCVRRSFGNVCGGLGPSGRPLRSPGTETKDIYLPKNCKEIPSNECFEDCLLEKFKETRPMYSWGGWPLGTNCHEWADDKVKECREKCKGKVLSDNNN